MESQVKRSDRRRFIKHLGIMAGAGTLLALGVNETARSPKCIQAKIDRIRMGRGYRLTPHIRSYYEKAGL